jgi:hypothetical protein
MISPLLANIVLNHLDWRLHEGGYRFVRYADDFVVLCRTKTGAEEALKVKPKLVFIGRAKLPLCPFSQIDLLCRRPSKL